MYCSGRNSPRVINLVAVAVSTALSAVPAFALQTHRFDIPEEPASAAIRAFGAQAHVQVIVAGEYVRDRKFHAVSGQLSTEEALNRLLRGTGLTHRFVNNDSVALLPVTLNTRQESGSGSSQQAESAQGGPDSSGSFLVAQATEGQTPGPVTLDKGNQSTAALEEVVVTAQKRRERVQDVPISISAINTASLVDTNQTTIVDYYTSVPGLSIAPLPQGGVNLGIRGITTNGTAAAQSTATTGILVDGVPIGTGNLYVPDLDPDDLERIEVLRGPQGTLYGASSMGGLINYVTKDPSFRGVSGHLEGGTNSVSNGGWGYTTRGSVNLPLGDDLAVRANAFTREDPGYIDNPYTGMTGVNGDHVSGGHLSLLWKPSDQFNVKLSALYQKLRAESTSDITTTNAFTGQPLGDLQQVYARNQTSYEHQEGDFGAIITYLFHDFEITSNTGYNFSTHHDSLDLSSALGYVSQIYFQLPTYTLDYDFHFRSVSEELRVSGPITSHLDGRLGLYYNRSEANPLHGWSYAGDPLTGTKVIQWGFFNSSPPGQYQAYDESAVFADLDYRFTKQWDVQIGGRESRVRQASSTEIITGQYVPLLDAPNVSPLVRSSPAAKQTPFTFLVSSTYKFTPDVMAYVRVASGFRPGAANSADTIAQGAPAEAQPDKVTSYEVGFKGVINPTLSTEVALYYVDWRDIQLQLTSKNSGYQYLANAGSAKSEGVDLNLHWMPLSGINVSAWASYDDAIITSYPSNAVSFYAAPGQRLPLAAELSGNVAVDGTLPIASSLSLFVGGTSSYVGGRESLFTGGSDRTYLPAYVKTDLHAGLNYGPWRVNTYVNNVANRRGVISGGLGNAVEDSFYYITPRNFGITFGRTF